MKIDGNQFMKWLHKIREEAGKEAKIIGAENKRIKDEEFVSKIVKKYGIPVVRV